MVDGGHYGGGRRTCANNVGQSAVSGLNWSGKASGHVCGRAGTVRDGEGRFLKPLVRAGNCEVSGYIPW